MSNHLNFSSFFTHSYDKYQDSNIENTAESNGFYARLKALSNIYPTGGFNPEEIKSLTSKVLPIEWYKLEFLEKIAHQNDTNLLQPALDFINPGKLYKSTSFLHSALDCKSPQAYVAALRFQLSSEYEHPHEIEELANFVAIADRNWTLSIDDINNFVYAISDYLDEIYRDDASKYPYLSASRKHHYLTKSYDNVLVRALAINDADLLIRTYPKCSEAYKNESFECFGRYFLNDLKKSFEKFESPLKEGESIPCHIKQEFENNIKFFHFCIQNNDLPLESRLSQQFNGSPHEEYKTSKHFIGKEIISITDTEQKRFIRPSDLSMHVSIFGFKNEHTGFKYINFLMENGVFPPPLLQGEFCKNLNSINNFKDTKEADKFIYLCIINKLTYATDFILQNKGPFSSLAEFCVENDLNNSANYLIANGHHDFNNHPEYLLTFAVKSGEKSNVQAFFDTYVDWKEGFLIDRGIGLDAMRAAIKKHSPEIMGLLIKNGLKVEYYENLEPPLIYDILTSGAPADKMNDMLQLLFGPYIPFNGRDNFLLSLLKTGLAAMTTSSLENGGFMAENKFFMNFQHQQKHLALDNKKLHETLENIPPKYIEALSKIFPHIFQKISDAELDEKKITLAEKNTHYPQGTDNSTEEKPLALLSNALFKIDKPIFNDVDLIIYKSQYYFCNEKTEDNYLKNPPDNTEYSRENVALTGVNTDSEFC